MIEQHLMNAAIVGENPDTAFIAEGNRLHAVDQAIANQKKDKSSPDQVLPLMREAYKALIEYSEGKVESHFLETDAKKWEGKTDEQSHLISHIHNIFTHLPHHLRNELSSKIHHKI